MMKSVSACLLLLISLATTVTLPTEARHHGKAKSCPVAANDNSPAGHFCGKWTGTMSGKDPHVNITLVLNHCGDNFKGTITCFSGTTGRCTRAVSGHYDATTKAAILKDDCISCCKPVKGCTFSKVKKYDLQLGSDSVTLSGSYESLEGKDFGSIDLSKPKTPPKK
jgi:hypothetical protein